MRARTASSPASSWAVSVWAPSKKTTTAVITVCTGPVVSEILDLLKHPPDVLGPLAEEWSRHFERVGYDIQMARPAALDPLSEAEVQLLTDTWDLFARLDQFQLSELTHRLFQEWSDPGTGARPITPEEILRTLGKSDEEIEEARQDALERAHFDDLFR